MAINPNEEFLRIISGLELPYPELDLNRYDTIEEQDFIEAYNGKRKCLFQDYEDMVVETHIEGKVAHFEPVAFSTYGPICNLYQKAKLTKQVVLFGSLYKSALMELNGLPQELFGVVPSLATNEDEVIKSIAGLPFIFTPYGFVSGGNLCYAQAESIDSLRAREPVTRFKQGRVYGEFTLVDAFGKNSEDLYAISHTVYIEDEPLSMMKTISTLHT